MFVRGLVATAWLVAWAFAAAATGGDQRAADAPLPAVDEAQVRAAGIRKLESRRLELYTDLPSQPAVDEVTSKDAGRVSPSSKSSNESRNKTITTQAA